MKPDDRRQTSNAGTIYFGCMVFSYVATYAVCRVYGADVWPGNWEYDRLPNAFIFAAVLGTLLGFIFTMKYNR